MENLNNVETKLITQVTEGSSNDSPIIDMKQHSPTEFTLSERAVKIENEDTFKVENSSEPSTNYSKRQLKRLEKYKNRLKMRDEWKSQRKLRNKERKSRNKSAMMLGSGKPKITPMSNSLRKFTVVIDFSYDELMSQKDLIKCGNQVVRCYSANRRSSNPTQLHFCNFSGKIEAELAKNNGYKNWDIHLHEDNYLEYFNKDNLVYLTSESRNVLETLDENKIYIIGGLVDHNAHKGVSYRKAVHEGISHAQLPIKKFVPMKSRSVLTINHVFEILLKVSNGESWAEALQSAVPTRFLHIPNSTNESKNKSPKTSDNEEKFDVKINSAENGEMDAPKHEIEVTINNSETGL